MSVNRKASVWQPKVVKYTQSGLNGIQHHSLKRCAIGYVLRGKKYFYCGDKVTEVLSGELFYLGPGSHYVEDVPGEAGPFEQVVFYCDTDSLNGILSGLNYRYDVDIANDHSCGKCRKNNELSRPASPVMKKYFTAINEYVVEGIFMKYPALEDMKLSELLYMIVSGEDNCIKAKLLESANPEISAFERMMEESVFEDLSIVELASKCGKSPTSFKKEFKRIYFESPHKWIIKQRLTQVRLLLVSTNKSISEIGTECLFPNTSHFIKLFRKEFGMTPAEFRSRNRHYTNGAETQPVKKKRAGKLEKVK